MMHRQETVECLKKFNARRKLKVRPAAASASIPWPMCARLPGAPELGWGGEAVGVPAPPQRLLAGMSQARPFRWTQCLHAMIHRCPDVGLAPRCRAGPLQLLTPPLKYSWGAHLGPLLCHALLV